MRDSIGVLLDSFIPLWPVFKRFSVGPTCHLDWNLELTVSLLFYLRYSISVLACRQTRTRGNKYDC